MLRDSPGSGSQGGSSASQLALEAQAALLPYALGAFLVGLPIFVWAASFAPNALLMLASLLAFAIAWAAFYGVTNWLKGPRAKDLRLRARVHVLGGLIWAGVVGQMAAFADAAGPARETLLMICLAAAAVCIFFTSPWLPSVLIVGPAAAAGPLIAVHVHPGSRELGPQFLGAVALALALALILNRMLRRQFDLAAEREALIAERARQTEEQRRLARSKSDLIATLSQEIRSGLTGVAHVLAAAAGASGRAAPTRDQLSAALDSANELLLALEATLDSETAEAGRLSVDIRPFDAIATAREAVAQLRPLASAKGLEIALHLDPALVEAETGAAVADPARVRQILLNLLGNAVKFTVRGRVEARLERCENGRLAIEVADTGPGLTPDELELAFRPFQRIARTSAGTPGAGLGLSLSRQLARLMGGEITAHSAPGVGSCFRLETPYEDAAPRDRTVALSEIAEALRPQSRALRMLIAEEDSLAAAMLRSVLEQLGHKVVQAADPRRLLDLARTCEFEMALIDGRLTDSDGVSAIAALKAQAPALPVIAVIGGDSEEAVECSRAGAQVILRRPVSVGAAARAIAEATRGGEAARQVA